MKAPLVRTSGIWLGLGLLAACGPTASGRPDGGGRGGDGGGGCPTGEQSCGGTCVNLDITAAHCGSCDHACADTQICNGGNCTDDVCTTSTLDAQAVTLPADIVLVVNNSGSMTDEAASVQASMNDFVAAITASGIKARVILISSGSNDSQGICVPAPVGSGSCPGDESLPLYRHVLQDVGSNNGLQLILDTYPQWKDQLRPEATKTIAIISDDNSDPLDAAGFTSAMVALDPTFAGFRFDAIVAPYALDDTVCLPCILSGNCAACDPCCGGDSLTGLICTALPAAEGVVYKNLVAATGGVLGDLCTQEFLPVFQDMATAVVTGAQLTCVYTIPDPPEGQNLDFGRVNVALQATAGGPVETIPNVPGGAAACGPGGGWHYDDPGAPTQIVLCPATCDLVQANGQAVITIKLGCATVVD